MKNNPYAPGRIVTRIEPGGACVAVDPRTGQRMTEKERIENL